LELIVEALLGYSRNVLAHRVIARVDVSVAIEKRRQDFGAGYDVAAAFKYSCARGENKAKQIRVSRQSAESNRSID
jgi:hypothetical protein